MCNLVENKHFTFHQLPYEISKDAKYTFKVPGIYAYWCTPHKAMGMIGFVVVGKDKSNLGKSSPDISFQHLHL